MNSTAAHSHKEALIDLRYLIMRRVSVMLFVVMLVAVSVVQQEASAAPTQLQIDNAISTGFTWLTSQQSGGSFGGDYPMPNTGFSVAALEHNAERLGLKPLDNAYAYHSNVQAGLNYLFASAQYDAANKWVYWNSVHDAYETGIPLMAIARSGAPSAIVSGAANGLNGKTYLEVAQMAADWLATAQDTVSGGWAYYKASPYGDQSATGWAAMGIGYAVHSMGCTMPANVVTRLQHMNYLIQSTTPGSSFGGADYTANTSTPGAASNSWHNVYKTGHLLYDIGLVGGVLADASVQNALTFMNTHWADVGNTAWNSTDTNHGWRGSPPTNMPSYAGMFSASKGFSEFGIDTFSSHNWYNDFAQVIVDTQSISGNNSWTGGSGGDGNAVRATAQALLVLVRAQSFLPPVATSSAATNITSATATINGNLTNMGSSTSVNVTFQYGTSPGVYTQETAIQTFTATSAFTVTLSNLVLGTTFYYRSKAVGTTNGTPTGTGYSAEISFTTPNTLTHTPVIANGTANPVTYAGLPFPDNTTRNFDFTTNTGYHLTGVSSACAGTATPAASFSYTNDTAGQTTASFTLNSGVNASCTVTATTAANVYSITASATDNNGSANVGGSISCPTTVNYGVDPTCTFTPASGYHVYDVIVDGSSVWSNLSAAGVNTTLASRALGVVASARTALVKFRKNTFLITTTPGTNGTITPANSYFDYGTTPTITVAGNSGYYVSTIGGTCGAAYSNTLPDYNVMSKPYTTNTISAPCSITSSYLLGYRYISTLVTPAGNAAVSCPASVIHGQTGSCTVTPNSGYHISGISGCFGSAYTASAYTNGTSGEISNTFSLGTVTNDCTVSASVAINQYDITATPDTHSKVDSYALNTPHTYSNMNYNSSQSVTFASDTGYHLTGITNSCSGTASATYSNVVNGPWTTSAIFTPSGTITNGVAANCGISATSAINVYSVTPSIVIVP